MANKIPDLPSTQDVPAGAMGWLKGWLDTLRLWAQTRDPNATSVGDPLDKFSTRRELVTAGLLQRKSDGTFELGVGGGVGPAGPTGPAGPPGTTYTPDLTPPPTPTGLTVTAGLTQIYIEWTAPTYTQGQGNAQTNIYGAIWVAGDTEPTFGDVRTKLIDVAGKGAVLWAYPSPLATTWCIWIKFQSVDGVESTSPAGGTHGQQCTTGKIGNVDLNDLIISANKLSAGTYPNINLVSNAGSEDGTEAWANVGTSGAGGTFDTSSTRIGGTTGFRLNVTGANGLQVGCRAFPVIAGETYSVKVSTVANTATAAGLYIRMIEKATKPSNGYVDSSNYDSVTDLVANGAQGTSWVNREFSYTVPAGVYWVTFCVARWTAGTNTFLYFDDCSVGRQITASFLAAGSIAAGSAVIGTGAIINFMLGTGSVDNVKIANVSAAKLTAGNLQIGSYIRSTTFTAGVAGFSIDANGTAEFNDITARGAIYASSGAIGGAVIASTYVQSSNYVASTSGWKLNNTGGTIEANAGKIGGAVLSATYVQSSNYVAGTSGWRLNNATGTIYAVDIDLSGAVDVVSTANVQQDSMVVSAFASATSGVSATGSDVAVLTAAAINPGSAGHCIVTLTANYSLGYSAIGEQDWASYSSPTFKIKRTVGGVTTTIATWTPPAGFGGSRQDTSYTIKDVPGGSAVYALTIVGPGASTPEGIYRRTMSVIGFKKST